MSAVIMDKWLLLVDDECASCQKAKVIKIVLDERGYNVIISCECPLCVFEYDTDNLPVVVGTTANDILKMIADIMKEKRRG